MGRITDVDRSDWVKRNATMKELCEKLWQYESIGLKPQQIKDVQFCLLEKSLECEELRRELQELKERDTAKTPVEFDEHWYKCPRCGKYSICADRG